MRKVTIRFKITLWYALLLLVLLVVFSFFLYMTISRILYRDTEELLKADAGQVLSIIQSEGYNININIPYKIIATNTYFVIFDVNGNTGLKSEILPEIVDLPILNKQGNEQLREISIDKVKWVVYDKPLVSGNQIIGWIRVSRSLQPMADTLFNLKLIMFISIPLYILFASAGGWFLANRALRPIDYITKTAREISKGDLNQRLRMPRTEDEVGRLAVTFDEMLNKLETSINKERQFASDASHELRTPIAIISAQAEEALSGAHKVKEYKEALSIVQNESKKMSHIISQLLMMYRSDEGRYKFNFEVLNLKLIVGEIVNEFQNIAKDNGIKISFDAEEEIKIRVDQTLITRLLINLIDNAVRYNKKGGKVSVNINRENGFAKIIVEDNGIGIADKEIPYIFDRFYQADKTRGNQGTGLGLSIVKWIVDLHKGEINVESKVNQGSKFVIKLPLNL